MNRADAPKKQPIPFAVNGQRGELLTKTPAGDNSASYDVGFPPATMILKAAGGLPPKGQDMNQIIYELSSAARWFSAGGMNAFDSTFCAGIGGYPMGSVILGNDGATRYMNTIESNTSDPNSGGSGWFNLTSGYLMTTNNLSEITASGEESIAEAQKNIGLGDVAIAGVASGDIKSPGYIKIPLVDNGGRLELIIQWGYGLFASQQSNVVNLPIAFPSKGFVAIASKGSSISASAEYSVGCQVGTSTITITNSNSSTSASQGISWIAIGY